MAPVLLTTAERDEYLTPLLMKGYQITEDRDSIEKEYFFSNFKDCFEFMKAIAAKAEELQHHPEWFNVYNRLRITWSTHDCQGLSISDVEMAEYCEIIYNKYAVV